MPFILLYYYTTKLTYSLTLTTATVICEASLVRLMAEEAESRFSKEPTVVEPQPPVDCNWKKGQTLASSTLRKCFGSAFHKYLPQKGNMRITKVMVHATGRHFTVEAKAVGNRKITYVWHQMWWVRGPKDERVEGFFYSGLRVENPDDVIPAKPPARKKKTTRKRRS
tara:strand:- start:765 stop:1265 length:501 start_codon:yes stop_codon:yes gene_type:complete